MFQLGAFTKTYVRYQALWTASAVTFQFLSSASQQFVHFALTVGLPRWRSREGRLFAACRPWLRRCYQHCLKHGDACRNLPRCKSLVFAAVWTTVKPVSSAITPLFTSWERASVLVSCRYVSCSLVWTGVMPLCGLCPYQQQLAELIRPSLLLAEMFDITGRT